MKLNIFQKGQFDNCRGLQSGGQIVLMAWLIRSSSGQNEDEVYAEAVERM